MPKIVGTRERIHQPFYDSLIRVDGAGDLRSANIGVFGAVQGRSTLFSRTGSDIAISNLQTAGFFPSDQTFVILAVRVWTYFRFNRESERIGGTNAAVGYAGVTGPVASGGLDGTIITDRVNRVHKLYHQSQNQMFWQFQAGDKPQLTTFTAYTPFAGGLDGFFADYRLYRANNGVPSSSALMRLARPILIPPRQGFVVVSIVSPVGQANGANLLDQLNGSVPNNDPWGAGAGTTGTVSGQTGTTGLSVAGKDDIEKDVKYLIDGVHSRDVL